MNEINIQKVEADLSTIVKMDGTMLAADRVMRTNSELEVCLDESMLSDTLKPDGKLKDSVARMTCAPMIRGMQPTSLRESHDVVTI